MKKAKLLSIAVHFLIVIAALLVWNCSEEDDNDGDGNLKVGISVEPSAIAMIEDVK